jgi:rRNA maturation endonuclease Nob1
MSLSKDGRLIINQQQKRLPKFCVSCGEKFLAENHKFCAECGTPRMLV